MEFPVEQFIEKLATVPFLLMEEKEARIIKDWYVSGDFDASKTYDDLYVKSSFGSFCLSINKERILRLSIHGFEEKSFLLTLNSILDDFDYACFFTSRERIINPAGEKAKLIFSWIEPLLPYLKMSMPRNRPHIKFNFFRHELDVDFNYEEPSIVLYYGKDKIASFESNEAVQRFLEHWLEKHKVIKDIFDEALMLALRYDKAAFIHRQSICVFSKDCHLGFSYYQLDGDFRYYTIHSFGEGKFEMDTTDTQELRNGVINYVEEFLKTNRIHAMLKGLNENFIFKILTDIAGYCFDFKDYIHTDSCSLIEVNNYISHHQGRYQLEKLSEDQHQFIEISIKTEKIKHMYTFGKYVFLNSNDKSNHPSFFIFQRVEVDG
jgi:hypothetical protein